MNCPKCGKIIDNDKKVTYKHCAYCGTNMLFTSFGEFTGRHSVPDVMRWRPFDSEPPKGELIIAVSMGMEPDEYYTDIAMYKQSTGEYERDYFEEIPIDWWRPIGPLPKKEEK